VHTACAVPAAIIRPPVQIRQAGFFPPPSMAIQVELDYPMTPCAIR